MKQDRIDRTENRTLSTAGSVARPGGKEMAGIMASTIRTRNTTHLSAHRTKSLWTVSTVYLRFRPPAQ